MQGQDVLFSSRNPNYQTPPLLYAALNRECSFILDPATDKDNWLQTPKFYTREMDGLSQSWADERFFLNPPFARKNAKKGIDGFPIEPWIKKSWKESLEGGATGVLLVPARMDTKWFHRWVMGKAEEIRLIPHRVVFWLNEIESSSGAGFPSMVVVYRPPGGFTYRPTRLSVWNYLGSAA